MVTFLPVAPENMVASMYESCLQWPANEEPRSQWRLQVEAVITIIIMKQPNARWRAIQFSCSVVSNFLWPHGLQHARPSCPSPTRGAYSNSCPLSRWCHWTSSSSVVPFSSHLQSFPTSGSFPVSQFFTLGGQSIGVPAPTSVLPMNIQD